MSQESAPAAVSESAPAPQIAPEATPGHALVWRWFNEDVANSDVSRHAPALNRLMVVLPHLIDAVDQALNPKG